MDAKELGNTPVGTVQGHPALHPDTGLPIDPYSGYGWAVDPHPGITLRQHFAGLAMQGILANRVYDPPRRDRLAMMAIDAVSAADCLLAELAKAP